MRLRRKIIWGSITDKGELSYYRGELNEFLKLHKGRNVLIRVEVVPIEASQKLTNYFFGYLVKKFQLALWSAGEDVNEQETYERIREVCPLFIKEERVNGKWIVIKKEWEELDQAVCVEVIAFLQRYASINYNTIIDDPK